MEHTPVATTQAGDKTLAILVHIGSIFFSWLAPLVVYLIKKGSGDEFATANAREALNFQITVAIGFVISIILSFVLIGIFLIWILVLANLILCIIAAVNASNGVVYRYPLTLRLVG